MHKNTKDLKVSVSQGCSLDDLVNSYEGEECYILLTGPSYNDYDKSELREKLKGKLVFCVKQAIEGLEDICDLHFWNCSNFPLGSLGIPYKYDEQNRPIVISSSNYALGARWSTQQTIDCFFKVPLIEEVGKENCLAIKRNFDDFLLSKTHTRNVGAGIMLETVLYFAVHFGVSKIKTLGWDLDTHGSHFYKSGVDNKGCEIPWDIEANAKAVPSIVEWLHGHGIELTTISKTSSISETVKREAL